MKSRNSFHSISVGLTASIIFFGCMSTAIGAETADANLVIANELPALSPSEIEGDVALQTKVSFTLKSRPIDELLLELSRQSGVSISSSSNALTPETHVTAHVQGVSLDQVLLSLSRLYGVRWQKTAATSFTMIPSDKNALEIGLLQVGDFNKFRGRAINSIVSSAEHKQWSQEIRELMKTIDIANRSPSFASTVPKSLADRIRREKELQAALQLLDMQHRAMIASINDYIITAEATKGNVGEANTDVDALPQLTIRTREGQPIVSLRNIIPEKNRPDDDARLNRPNFGKAN